MSKKNNLNAKLAQSRAQKKKIRDKIYAFILLAFFIFWTVCSALSIINFCSGRNSSGLIKAGAEEVETVAAESGIDLSQYPSANLIKFPYVMKDGYKVGGITFNINNDGTMLLNGISTMETWSYIDSYNVNVGEVYSFSCNSEEIDRYKFYMVITQDFRDGTSRVASEYVTNKLTIVEGVSRVRIGFRVVKGAVLDNVLVKPMFNAGNVLYPYIPPFDLIYNDGYTAGESIGNSTGYENGYSAGVLDGESQAKYGFWQNTKIKSTAVLSNGSTVEHVSIPTLVAQGIDLSYLYDYYADTYGVSSVGSVTIALEFDPEVYCKLFAVRASGPTHLFGTSHIYDTTIRYKDKLYTYDCIFQLVDDSFYGFMPASNSVTLTDDFYFVSISDIVINNLEDFKGFTFYNARGYYGSGYNEGYSDGYGVGYDEGIVVGGAESYDKGYINGKNIGYEQGLQDANQYTFLSLISSVVDVPIRAITSLFEFDILGVNMKTFFLSLFTVAVILAVVKMIL